MEAKDWEELDRFAKAKKSPIGYAVRRRPLTSAGPHLMCVCGR